MKKIWHYYNPKFEYETGFPIVDQNSAWVGHKYFVYDLIRNIKPKVIVELGTHYGCSFFTMCQAVKDGKTNSQLFAVDTWKGDKHSGFFNESVFIEVNKIKNTYYKSLKIQLLKTTFDKAVNKFEDSSIDILHIDGLHTYKAVKHDFETWFDKVTKNGVILLHDIFEKKDDFGVYKLWNKLKKKYSTLEFKHSHGLGILFKNRKTNKYLIFEKIWQLYYLKSHINSVLRKNKQIIDQYLNEKNLLEIEIKNLKKQVNDLNITLNRIQSAKTYKIWQGYCKIRDKILRKIGIKNENTG